MNLMAATKGASRTKSRNERVPLLAMASGGIGTVRQRRREGQYMHFTKVWHPSLRQSIGRQPQAHILRALHYGGVMDRCNLELTSHRSFRH